MKTKWFRGGVRSLAAVHCVATIFVFGWLLTEARASANYASVVLADNPGGYWRLGETNVGNSATSGMTGADLSPNVNTLYYFTTAKLGLPGAIADDPNKSASKSAASVGIGLVSTSPSLSPTTAITLEMWLTTDSLSADVSPLMKVKNGAWDSGYGLYWESGKLDFFVNGYTGATAGVTFGTSAAYQHVVGTYNGSILDLYINGSLVASNAYVGSVGTNSADLLIGVGKGSSSFVWDGKVDEVAIYDYALSSTQVMNHYTVGMIPEPSSILLLLAGGLALRQRQRNTCS